MIYKIKFKPKNPQHSLCVAESKRLLIKFCTNRIIIVLTFLFNIILWLEYGGYTRENIFTTVLNKLIFYFNIMLKFTHTHTHTSIYANADQLYKNFCWQKLLYQYEKWKIYLLLAIILPYRVSWSVMSAVCMQPKWDLETVK